MSKVPEWLHPATLRWVAKEADTAAREAERIRGRLRSERGPDDALLSCWEWIVGERRGLRFRLRNIATRVEKRRG